MGGFVERLKDDWIKRFKREKINLRCEFREGNRIWQGTMINVSLSGAKIITVREFDKETKIDLYLKKEFSIVPVNAVITRISVKEESVFLGLKFPELNPQAKKELNRLLNSGDQ